jgi:CelD/BcsL family acetyltransferase involved in cellulose biosynthesis
MLMTRDAQLSQGRIHIVPATSADADAVAALAEPSHQFLRGSWAEAAPGEVRRWAALRGDGRPLAVFPLVARHLGPFEMREVAGCYWPFRSVAMAADADQAELAGMLGTAELKRALGPLWRLGPVFDSDPAALRLIEAARAAGWSALTRLLGTCFEIDVAALRAEGPWPRAATMKKNRWREKQIAQHGELEITRFSGSDWNEAQREAIARVERGSWLARLPGPAALQFADPARRLYWERVAADPVIAAMLFGSILKVGGVPAAFTFGLQVGGTRYHIANNYAERFKTLSVGRTLLLKEFEQATASGVERISWGSGDAGYKSEMGALPGPKIVDLLFVRPPLLAPALRPWWCRPVGG